MWKYKIQGDLGYRIYYEKDTIHISFLVPYRWEQENTILLWSDELINDLVNGLNDGSIPIDINRAVLNEKIGFKFSFTIPSTFGFKKIEIEK